MSRFIYVVTHDRISFFSHSWIILPYVIGGNYKIFLIYSFIYRYLCCLCILAILKNPVINIGVHMFSFVYTYTETIAGLHMVVQFLIFWVISVMFHVYISFWRYKFLIYLQNENRVLPHKASMWIKLNPSTYPSIYWEPILWQAYKCQM